MRRTITGLVVAGLLAGCAGSADLEALESFTLADIDSAYRWAIWNRDEPAMRCLPTLRAAVIHLHSDDLAAYGVLTWGQIAGDLANPSGRIRADCAALAAERKAQVNSVIGRLATLLAGGGL